MYDFPVWGLVTTATPHRVCYHLNKVLHIDIIWDKEIFLDNSDSYVNLYKYSSDIDFFTIEIIQNKNGNSIFIPELRNIDLFLLIRGELEMIDVDTFVQHIRGIDAIQNIISLPIMKIKSRNNFLIYQ